MLRFGLCCQFIKEPIKFRQTTATALLKLPYNARIKRVSELCLGNVLSLEQTMYTLQKLDIGAFRVMSPLFPRYTHPEVGYHIEELPEAMDIIEKLKSVGELQHRLDIRLSFHPDQFVLLSSPNTEVTRKSILELDYQAMLAELIGADVINIHAGGVYGNKPAALDRLCNNVSALPKRVLARLTLENDDVSYTVADLLPVCFELKIPLVYDVHHHRCNPDGMSINQATQKCIETWENSGRGEPYFHISSPKNSWNEGNPKPHAEMIDINDFPRFWQSVNATIDIEAKAKELAVLTVMREIKHLQ